MKTIKEEVGEISYNLWPVGAKIAIERLEKFNLLQWTNIKPTKEGFYYIKELEYNIVYMCSIEKAKRPDMKGRLMIHNSIDKFAETLSSYKDDNYLWCKIPNPPK